MKTCKTCHRTFPGDYAICPQDGTPLSDTATWTDGIVIRGKYKILGLVGRGGMGSVYKAQHLRFNELRAIKVMSQQLSNDPTFLRRFEQEAILARKLQHPNAVRIDDIDEAEDGRPFIVMEYIDGTSLKRVIKDEAPLSFTRVCNVTKQVLAALTSAHSLGIVHRDIKPDNIMLVSNGGSEQVKVLDFGIARALDSNESGGAALTKTGLAIGTVQYMSPEQAFGERIGPGSDIYSLGVVIYEMLTGALPAFKNDTPHQLPAGPIQDVRIAIQELRPDLPDDVGETILSCLAVSYDSRLLGSQLLERIEAWQQGQEPKEAINDDEDRALRTVVLDRGHTEERAARFEASTRESEVDAEAEEVPEVEDVPYDFMLGDAVDAMNTGDFAAAEGILNTAIPAAIAAKENAEYLQAFYLRRGQCRLYMERFQEAIEDFTECIRVDTLWRDKAGAWGDNALDDEDDVSVFDPGQEAFLGRGVARLNCAEGNGALDDFKMALQLDSRDYYALFGRAVMRAALHGDRKGALEDLKKASQMSLDAGNNSFYEVIRERSEAIRGATNLRSWAWRGMKALSADLSRVTRDGG